MTSKAAEGLYGHSFIELIVFTSSIPHNVVFKIVCEMDTKKLKIMGIQAYTYNLYFMVQSIRCPVIYVTLFPLSHENSVIGTKIKNVKRFNSRQEVKF
jgi:hypothetical protein